MSEHSDATMRLVHCVEFVDHHNRDPRACVPSRIYLDGIEVTGALAHSPLELANRWSVGNHRGALVVSLSLYPGKTHTIAGAYGPGTYRVLLLVHPEMAPIELCTPDYGDGEPPVHVTVEGREVVRFYAESVQFRQAHLTERTALVFVR
jgi:hypothetical protein